MARKPFARRPFFATVGLLVVCCAVNDDLSFEEEVGGAAGIAGDSAAGDSAAGDSATGTGGALGNGGRASSGGTDGGEPDAGGTSGEGADMGGTQPGGSDAGAGQATGGQATSQGGSPDESTGGAGGVPPGEGLCEFDADCESNVCIEGVCCNESCADDCYGCTRAQTGQPDGTCAPVRAGTDPYESCEPDADECGLDGECDGDGTCRFAGADTSCAPDVCEDDQFTAESHCDGAGACETPAAVSCNTYACSADGTACRTSCTSPAHCAADAYCDGSDCAAQKSANAVCSSDEECLSGDCSGRCCEQGVPCACPQPTVANLVDNPGFDQNLSNWTLASSAGTWSWDADDAPDDGTACPFSGSVSLTSSEDGFSTSFGQCVPVSMSTDYNFGVRIISVSGDATCYVDLYSDTSCSTSGTGGGGMVQWINTYWSDFLTASFNSETHNSAHIWCLIPGAGGAKFDRFYLSEAPATY